MFSVIITETLQRKCNVPEAKNETEALEIVQRDYYEHQIIVLDSDDFCGVEFEPVND